MAIEKNPIVIGAGSIVMGSGGAVNFSNGGIIARTAAGTYTFTADQPLALSEAFPTVQPIVAKGVAYAANVVQTSATVWTITTSATLGGAAADVAGSLAFKLEALGNPGTSL